MLDRTEIAREGARVQKRAQGVYAERDLVRSANHAHIVVHAEVGDLGVEVGREVAPANGKRALHRYGKPLGNVAEGVDAHVLRTEKPRAQIAGAHAVPRQAKRVHSGGADQVRVAQRQRLRQVVVSNAVGLSGAAS